MANRYDEQARAMTGGKKGKQTRGEALATATGAFSAEIAPQKPKTYAYSAEEAGLDLTDEELQATINGLYDDAKAWTDERAVAREKAARYYEGQVDNPAVEEGRSTVTLTPFRDAVRRILPSVIRPFVSGERYMEFRPTSARTVKLAEQQTAYVNDNIIIEKNNGFLKYYMWFKDALVKRLGVVMWWYDETEECEDLTAGMQNPDNVAALRLEEGVEITSVTPVTGVPGGLVDVEFTRCKKKNIERFEPIPPEQWLESRNARDLDDATLVGRRMKQTTAQLLALGYSEETITEHGGYGADLKFSIEELQRQKEGGAVSDVTATLPAEAMMHEHDYAEVYVTLPKRGRARLHKVCLLGPEREIVNIEPATERPFAVLVPDPTPHTATQGEGPPDWTMDLQEITTSIARQLNNSLALAINNRVGIVEGEVNIDDVLNPVIGGPIRMTKPGMIQTIEHSFVGKEALGVLSFYKEVERDRLAVMSDSAGLDIDALQSTTKSGVDAAVSMAQLQVEMIARVFAETGVRRLMKGLRRMVAEHPDPERIVRMQGEYVPVDAEVWEPELDLTINVGLGAGLIEQRLAIIAGNAAKQEAILAQQGLDNPLVSPTELYNSYTRMLRLGGIMDTDSFWKKPDPNWKPTPPPPPDDKAGEAALMIAQAELKKAQNDLAAKEADAKLDRDRAVVEEQRRALDLELKREEIHLTDERERDKIEADVALRVQEINAKYNAQLTIEQLNADIKKQELALDTRVRIHKIERDAEGRITGATESVEDQGE